MTSDGASFRSQVRGAINRAPTLSFLFTHMDEGQLESGSEICIDRDGGVFVEGDSSVEQYSPGRKSDKQMLAHLLRLIAADALAQGQSLHLDTNEELPRLIPILCRYFSGEELTELLGKQTAGKILEMQRTEMLQNLFLEGELQKVLHTFNQAGIPLLLFKGPALAYTIYPQPHLRTYHDFDVLIHPQDVARVHELLTQQMGYTAYDEYRTDTIDEQRTSYNYSLQIPGLPFLVILELHTAPHESEIGTLFDRDALWQNARAITILGEPTITMSPADHLLYLCWHYRFHGFTRLMWLYDLVMLLRRYADELDWDTLIAMAHRQHMGATLYYCLSWCHELFGTAVPASVFDRLRPPLASRLIVERIALPDVAKALAVASYQDRRILARRGMVDRNVDLFKAGLRMLFPSRIAIQKRYMEHSKLPLQLFFLFYLIHPWVTLAKGGRLLLKRKKKTQAQDKGKAS